MARTINGNLTGKAAATERREAAENIEVVRREERRQHVMSVCQQIADRLTAEEYSAWWLSTPDSGFSNAAETKLAALIEQEQAALAHIDSLVGDERLTVSQMIDATELPFDATPCELMPQIDFDGIDEIAY